MRAGEFKPGTAMTARRRGGSRVSRRPFGLAAIALLLLCGCAGETIDYIETKRIDEKVTEPELRTFLAIVESLADKKLPKLPPVFAAPPEWHHARTLPVNELVNEERTMLDDRWSVEALARALDRNRPLQRALRREQLTPEQFVGLTLAIGAALSKTTLRDDQKLDDILAKGQIVLQSLSQETESFSSLSRERRHYFLQQAAWVTRVDRAKRLTLVPPENSALVEKHRAALEAIFPGEFKLNPLDAIADLLEERGMPFEELPVSGTDDQIEWNPDEAIVGHDEPDSQYAGEKVERQLGTRRLREAR
jgi:hypothetical protein